MKFKNKYYRIWHKKFAWFPTTIGNGVTIWFGFYDMRYREKGKKCDCGCQCPICGWWEYRKSIL